MDVKKILKPKVVGGTIIKNYGFSTTTNSSYAMNGGQQNSSQINADTVNATIITGSSISGNDIVGNNGTFDNLTATNFSNTSYAYFQNGFSSSGNVTLSGDSNDELNTENINHIMGDGNYFDSLTGMTNSMIVTDTLASLNIVTDYLTVNRSAHFYELVLDKLSAVGGSILFTPGDGFEAEIVEEDTANNVYKIYWRACSEIVDGPRGMKITDPDAPQPTEKVSENMWAVNDLARCQTFNLSNGNGSTAANKYWWRRVQSISTAPEINTVDDSNYYFHWIKVYKNNNAGSTSEVDTNSDAPEAGDTVVMLGNTSNASRQGAVYIASYSSIDPQINAPLFAEYVGINSFNLSSRRQNWIAFSANGNVESTQIKGNIVLSGSGETVEDYIDQAVAGITQGTQYFSNIIVFENQSVSFPCDSDGYPLFHNWASSCQLFHGDTALNIQGASSTGNITVTYSGRTVYLELTSSQIDLLNDTNIFPITIIGEDPDYATNHITYTITSNLYINKVKDGMPGDDGLTPIIYELSTSVNKRTYDNNTATPSSVTVQIYATDQSRATNKIYLITSVPNGMSLWYRRYDASATTPVYNYVNISSLYNSGYTLNLSATDGVDFYILNQAASVSSFNDTKIYDIQSIPLLFNGEDGEDGTDGENGILISANTTAATADVSKNDTFTASISGNLLYRDGTQLIGNHQFTGFKLYVDNDAATKTQNNTPGKILKATVNINTNGNFSWQATAINNWHNFNTSVLPRNIIGTIKDANNNIVDVINVPVKFEAGATLQITNEIKGTVQGQQGEITQLQQTATGISARVGNIENGLDNTGIDITLGNIDLRADKVTFSNSSGTISNKISIDPTTGTLNAENANLVNANVSGLFTTQQGLNKVEIDATSGGINMYGPDTEESGAVSAQTLKLGWGAPSRLDSGTCGEIIIYAAVQDPNVALNTFINSERIEIQDNRGNYGSKLTLDLDGISFRKWNPYDDDTYSCSWQALIQLVNRLNPE